MLLGEGGGRLEEGPDWTSGWPWFELGWTSTSRGTSQPGKLARSSSVKTIEALSGRASSDSSYVSGTN